MRSVTLKKNQPHGLHRDHGGHGGLTLELQTTQLREKEIDVPKVSILTNSMNYLKENVFITQAEDGFRLFVIHTGELLFESQYLTPSGAKIAFLNEFGDSVYPSEVIPKWTPFLPPGPDWEPLEILKKEQQK